VQWVQPRLADEVGRGEWTGGQVLRHRSWRGLRTGKNPGDLRRDS
jgi:bifunctional non-homologous end joining protein LigD